MCEGQKLVADYSARLERDNSWVLGFWDKTLPPHTALCKQIITKTDKTLKMRQHLCGKDYSARATQERKNKDLLRKKEGCGLRG
jgi:hypothetical protein